MNTNFEIDYVYQPGGGPELKTVRVSMCPDNNARYFLLEITAAEEISSADLGGIINALWTDRFTKLRIDPVADCKIRLSAADRVYDVVVSQTAGGISVDELRGGTL